MKENKGVFTSNPWEYTVPGQGQELQYLSIGLTAACNFRCTFCSKADSAKEQWDPILLRKVLREARELGLQKVEFTGGEPLLFPGIVDLIVELKDRGITSLVVTNGSLIEREIAARLARAEAMIAVSLTTLQEEKFNKMTGTRGEFPRVLEGIEMLRTAGLGRAKPPLLAVQAVASRDNIEEIPRLEQWAAEQEALFILNRPIPVGAMDQEALISPRELQDLLGPGARVPFSLDSPCNRLRTGCYIGSDGLVRPCPCIDLDAGSVREQSLTAIWEGSSVLKVSRNINSLLQGSCGQCAEKNRCYGCRAVAYAVFKKLGAPDPGCFRYVKNQYDGGEG